jgi:hypothetical protein
MRRGGNARGVGGVPRRKNRGTMPGPPDPPATGPRVEVRDGLRAGEGFDPSPALNASRGPHSGPRTLGVWGTRRVPQVFPWNPLTAPAFRPRPAGARPCSRPCTTPPPGAPSRRAGACGGSCCGRQMRARWRWRWTGRGRRWSGGRTGTGAWTRPAEAGGAYAFVVDGQATPDPFARAQASSDIMGSVAAGGPAPVRLGIGVGRAAVGGGRALRDARGDVHARGDVRGGVGAHGGPGGPGDHRRGGDAGSALPRKAGLGLRRGAARGAAPQPTGRPTTCGPSWRRRRRRESW